MIRSMKVALMADAFGKTFIPHMSGGGLGFLYNIILVSLLQMQEPIMNSRDLTQM